MTRNKDYLGVFDYRDSIFDPLDTYRKAINLVEQKVENMLYEKLGIAVIPNMEGFTLLNVPMGLRKITIVDQTLSSVVHTDYYFKDDELIMTAIVYIDEKGKVTLTVK